MSRVGITIDCREPAVLVAFWCVALGYVPEPPPGGHATWLAYWREQGIPDDELEGAGARALRVLAPDGANYYAVVMADPEGNEFCVS